MTRPPFQGMATGPTWPGCGVGIGYWMPRDAANRNDGVVPEIVQAIRHQVSVMAVPSVRRICPPTVVAAVNVSRVVGAAKVLSTLDSTRAVRLGVVPATDRTCSAAYSRLPAATAPRLRPGPTPVAGRAVPGGGGDCPRTSGQLLFA